MVAQSEFLKAASFVDGVILSVAVLQAERRISAITQAKPEVSAPEKAALLGAFKPSLA